MFFVCVCDEINSLQLKRMKNPKKWLPFINEEIEFCLWLLVRPLIYSSWVATMDILIQM